MKILLFITIVSLPISIRAQEENKTLENIDKQLASKTKSVSEVLTDPAYMNLHSLTSFRNIIKKNARPEKISLVNKNEPGIPATIKCKLTGSGSFADLLVYVYQTDNRGWYADTGAHVLIREGDRGHARLFGYVRSDKNGQIEFRMIHPQGYPRSDLPQHIHLEVFDKDGKHLLGTELLFEDDARLQGETRRRALQGGYVIAKNEGTSSMQVYSYSISLQ